MYIALKNWENLPKMPRFRILDWILVVLILVAIYNFGFFGSKNDMDIVEVPRKSREWLTEDIREMCQFLEQEITGEEGDQWVKGNEYEKKLKLRGIHVTFRHGERSPMSEVADETGCLPSRDEDRKMYAMYKQMADSQDVRNFLNIDPSISNWARYPHDSKCTSQFLTAEGALQHWKLGKYFKEKYGKSMLFRQENHRIVSEVTTSKRLRTLQSALAFSTGFLFPLSQYLSPITIRASNYTFQCLDEFCACQFGKEMRKKYEKEHIAYFESKADKETREQFEFIRKHFPEFSIIADPFEIIDVTLGRFLCRRKSLPCHGEECLTIDFLNQMINTTTLRGSAMFNDSKSIARRLQVIESYPIIAYLSRAIQDIRQFPHSNRIRVFSAHDSVVGPLLRVLGIPFVDPPHYTSRLVFEIYEHLDEGLFVRVVYNGHNRSYDVEFCRGENLKFGMCRAAAFEKFAKSGLLDSIGVQSVKEACYL